MSSGSWEPWPWQDWQQSWWQQGEWYGRQEQRGWQGASWGAPAGGVSPAPPRPQRRRYNPPTGPEAEENRPHLLSVPVQWSLKDTPEDFMERWRGVAEAWNLRVSMRAARQSQWTINQATAFVPNTVNIRGPESDGSAKERAVRYLVEFMKEVERLELPVPEIEEAEVQPDAVDDELADVVSEVTQYGITTRIARSGETSILAQPIVDPEARRRMDELVRPEVLVRVRRPRPRERSRSRRRLLRAPPLPPGVEPAPRRRRSRPRRVPARPRSPPPEAPAPKSPPPEAPAPEAPAPESPAPPPPPEAEPPADQDVDWGGGSSDDEAEEVPWQQQEQDQQAAEQREPEPAPLEKVWEVFCTAPGMLAQETAMHLMHGDHEFVSAPLFILPVRVAVFCVRSLSGMAGARALARMRYVCMCVWVCAYVFLRFRAQCACACAFMSARIVCARLHVFLRLCMYLRICCQRNTLD